MLGVVLELHLVVSTPTRSSLTYVGIAGTRGEIDEVVGPGHRKLA